MPKSQRRKQRVSGAEGLVYFLLAAACGLVKIGWTGGAIKDRARSVQGQSPFKVILECIGAVRGTEKLEDKIQKSLVKYRDHGEWYRTVPAVMAAIEELKAAADPRVWADAHMVYYPSPPPPNNGASCAVVPVSVDGTARQRPVLGTSKPSLAILKENLL